MGRAVLGKCFGISRIFLLKGCDRVAEAGSLRWVLASSGGVL